jgi:hypothetical protein
MQLVYSDNAAKCLFSTQGLRYVIRVRGLQRFGCHGFFLRGLGTERFSLHIC